MLITRTLAHFQLPMGKFNMVEDDVPNPLGILANNSRCLCDGHAALYQNQEHRFQKQRESALRTSPRDCDPLNASPRASIDTRDMSVHITLILEEIEVPPGTLLECHTRERAHCFPDAGNGSKGGKSKSMFSRLSSGSKFTSTTLHGVPANPSARAKTSF